MGLVAIFGAGVLPKVFTVAEKQVSPDFGFTAEEIQGLFLQRIKITKAPM